jgi:hypothetical protein
MGKRARIQVADDRCGEDRVFILRRCIERSLLDVSHGCIAQLHAPSAHIEAQIRLSDTNHNIFKDMLLNLPSDTISKLLDVCSNNNRHPHIRIPACTKLIYSNIYNIITDLTLKLEQARTMLDNTTEYFLRLNFPDIKDNSISWTEIVKTLSLAAVRSGERNVEHQAQQAIQQAQQQAQQQAMQGQGDMQH